MYVCTTCNVTFSVFLVHAHATLQQYSDTRRSRSRSPRRTLEKTSEETINVEELSPKELDDAMASVMGFSGFKSTKGKRVGGSCNASGIANKSVKKYRQYMNRRGGFNRPLDRIK